MAMIGGVEAGGTKFVCAVGSGPDDARVMRFPTTTPDETIGQALAFFREQAQSDELAAIGIGSFGPVNVDSSSPGFGHITTTPKPGWRNVDLAGEVRRVLGVPVAFDTDVNAAALGEYRWGAGQGLDTFVYLTVGTGIGGGAMVGGRLAHGLVHPEMGHMRVPHDRYLDPFGGICPFHGDCLEGLASGPALLARWGTPAHLLAPDHPAWPLQAQYLALALANIICVISPQRILLGGGVMKQAHLFPLVRRGVLKLLNGYVQHPTLLDGMDRFIAPPALGDRAGVLGAMALAQQMTV